MADLSLQAFDDQRFDALARLPALRIETNWIAISGSPSSGKTTLVRALETAGFPVFYESADEILQEIHAAGRNIDEAKRDGQFSRKIALAEIRRMTTTDRHRLTIFDTTCVDHIVYDEFYSRAVPPVMPWLADHVRFRAVFHLDVLPVFETTTIRTETAEQSRKISSAMKARYEALGYLPISVPVMESAAHRVDLVLRQLRELPSTMMRG